MKTPAPYAESIDHSADDHSSLSRRKVMALAAPVAAAAIVGPTTLARPAAAATSGVGADMLDKASAFLASLEAEQLDAATFEFDSNTRRRWSFMHGSRFAPGLALESMAQPQKDAALDLLATALSPDGMVTAERIMLQQDILRDEWGKGSPDRNRERFSVALFGTPSLSEPWGWRFEGHHLSLSFTLSGDTVISVTPSSFSSEPNTVPSGPHKGLVVLQEEAEGRRLYSDLSDANRRAALISERSYGNILTTAGREDRLAEAREGVPLADLPQAQVDLALRLIEVYAVDRFAAPLAKAERARVGEGDIMATRFAWAGADLGGSSIYYRLHGETFLIEFATLRNQPQHHHAIRHDAERNLGSHRLG